MKQYKVIMPFDKVAHFILGLAFFCIFLTLVAIGAQAGDQEVRPSPASLSVQGEASAAAVHPAQALIKRQLDAISARDGDLAWSMTTGPAHGKFKSGKEYLSHLRFHLRPIYNHGDYRFTSRADTQTGLIQKMEIKDHEGEPVTVIYRLEKQPDGGWLIDSFAALEREADPI